MFGVGSVLRHAAACSEYNAAAAAAVLPLNLLLFRSISSSKLFVGGLSWGVDKNILKDAFTFYGNVTEVEVATDFETGRSKGYGFVSFTSNDEAEAALRGMNGRDLAGRTIRADYAQQKVDGLHVALKGIKGKFGSDLLSSKGIYRKSTNRVKDHITNVNAMNSESSCFESFSKKVNFVGTYDNNVGSNWRNL